MPAVASVNDVSNADIPASPPQRPAIADLGLDSDRCYHPVVLNERAAALRARFIAMVNDLPRVDYMAPRVLATGIVSQLFLTKKKKTWF